MNSYRFNQIAMAVLAALLLFFGVRTIIAIHNAPPEIEPTAPKPAPQQASAAPSIDELLQTASVAKGKQDAAICEACHNLKKGGPNMVGPNLYGVLGRKIGSHPGFAYSTAVKNKGGVWTYAKINKMITDPAKFIPGTKMSIFPGIHDAKKRADIIAYLRTLNANPPPLPKAPAKAAAAAPAPAKKAFTAASDTEVLKLLPKASAARGKQDAAICEMCHNLKKGGPNMVGPNLYGVLGRKIGSHPGFAYSTAVKNKGGVWTYQKIDRMITDPAKFIPGTKMSIFPGIHDAKKRADIIAYLRTLNANPPPLPGGGKAAAPAKAPAAAPATTPAPAKTPAPEKTPAAPANSGSSSGGTATPPASSGSAAPSGGAPASGGTSTTAPQQ